MEKLNYEDSLMLDLIIEKINELVEADKETNKRIDRLWKFLRLKENQKKGESNE